MIRLVRPELRTAATSAVGTRLLARPNSENVGLFGAGNQARAHLVALSTIYRFKQIKVYARSPEHREGFALGALALRKIVEKHSGQDLAVEEE